MYQVAFNFLFFLIICIFGYLAETLWVLLKNKKLTNRGFLCGPYIPIYGFGGILMFHFLTPLKNNFILVFILGMVVATVLEYIAAYVLEKIFRNKWWDYSKEKFNLHGRICLLNSVAFGIGALLIVYLAGPIITDFLNQLKPNILILIGTISFVIFFLDSIYSIIVAYNLRHRLIIVEQLKAEKLAKIPLIFEQKLRKQMAKFKRFPNRLVKAFPYLFNSNETEFKIMKDVQEKIKINKKQTKKNKKTNKKNNKNSVKKKK